MIVVLSSEYSAGEPVTVTSTSTPEPSVLVVVVGIPNIVTLVTVPETGASNVAASPTTSYVI